MNSEQSKKYIKNINDSYKKIIQEEYESNKDKERNKKKVNKKKESILTGKKKANKSK